MTLVYLSGPIIHGALRRDDFYHTVIRTLQGAGVEVFAPQFIGADSPRAVFERDTSHVRACDVVVAEVSGPSHGVGMEIMLSVELRKPVLLFRHTDAQPLSFMVRGAPSTALFEYASLTDVESVLGVLPVDRLVVHQCGRCTCGVAVPEGDGLRCIECGGVMGRAHVR